MSPGVTSAVSSVVSSDNEVENAEVLSAPLELWQRLHLPSAHKIHLGCMTKAFESVKIFE